MVNEIHLEALKEELARTEQDNRELKAHCKRLTIHLLNSGSSQWWADEAKKITEQAPCFSLAENNLQVVERLIYGGGVAFAQSGVMDELKAYANKFRAVK